MADAVIIDIADAVVAVLRGADLSLGFEAERSYVPVRNLRELARLTVTVVPATLAPVAVSLSRESDDIDYELDIGIQQHVDRRRETLDALTRFVQEVVDLFRNKQLAGYPAARCFTFANRPIFDPDHLDQHGVFTSVVTLTFRAVRGPTT